MKAVFSYPGKAERGEVGPARPAEPGARKAGRKQERSQGDRRTDLRSGCPASGLPLAGKTENLTRRGRLEFCGHRAGANISDPLASLWLPELEARRPCLKQEAGGGLGGASLSPLPGEQKPSPAPRSADFCFLLTPELGHTAAPGVRKAGPLGASASIVTYLEEGG